jgi:hypothetical protein
VDDLPAQVQDRVAELLTDPQNEVSVDMNSQEGKAHVICKNGLRTSTLKASWTVVKRESDTKKLIVVQPNDTSTAAPLASLYVSNNKASASSENHADPKFGLRKLT